MKNQKRTWTDDLIMVVLGIVGAIVALIVAF